MDEALEVMLAEREITRVMLQYARGIDGRDFDGVRGCFHPDARVEYGDYWRGDLDETIAFLSSTLTRLQRTLHAFTPPWIELDLGAGRAECETRSVNSVLHPPDDAGVSLQNVTGSLYRDVFERRDGRWRIVHRRNESLWQVNVPETAQPIPSPES